MRLDEEHGRGTSPAVNGASRDDVGDRNGQIAVKSQSGKSRAPSRPLQAQPDAAWRDEMESICKQELELHNIDMHQRIGLGSTGAVMRCTRIAEGREQQVALKVYHLGGALPNCTAPPHDPRCTYNEVMRQYGLFHPHVVQMHAIVRTQHFLCIVMELANGGDVFRLVKSSGGLPEPAARFIFQQLALTLNYLHSVGMYIRDVKPSNLLIFWTASGMPILKITDFNLAKDTSSQGPTRTPVSCTMYTAPQVLRNRGKSYEQMAPYAPMCDVWSAAVTLYYLVYAKWPFSKNQILSWASPGSSVEWEKVKFSKKTKHGRVSSQLIDLLTRIFSCGNMSAKEFQQMGVTVDNLIGCPWFQQDLPTGALDMREHCLEQTRARVGSTDYENVRDYLLLAAQEYLSSAPSATPSGGVPAGAGWLPEVPAAKQPQASGMAIADWMAGFTDSAHGDGMNGYAKGGRGADKGRSAVKENGMVHGGGGGLGHGAAGMDGVGMAAADMGDGDGE